MTSTGRFKVGTHRAQHRRRAGGLVAVVLAASVVLAVGAVGWSTLGPWTPTEHDIAHPPTAAPPAGDQSGPAPAGRRPSEPGSAGAELTPVDARRFAPGSCDALRVTDARATVVIDAGHGGRDPGAVGRTTDGRSVTEKDVTAAVADAVAQRLVDRRIDVVLSRSPSVSEPADGPLAIREVQEQLTARARCANAAGAAALVSIHANSFDDETVRGVETVYEQHRALGGASRRLAGDLQKRMVDAWAGLSGRPVPDRGLVDDSAGGESTRGHLVLLGPAVPGYIDEPTRMPGALVEPAFITHPADASLLASSTGVRALAQAIGDGVDGFLGSSSVR